MDVKRKVKTIKLSYFVFIYTTTKMLRPKLMLHVRKNRFHKNFQAASKQKLW